MKLLRPVFYCIATALTLTQTACVGTTPSAEFYLLEPIGAAEPAANDTSAEKVNLVLKPVKIPDYLDRAQIVTAGGKNSYRLDEWHRWAENLGNNITRVMQLDLSALLPANVVTVNAQRPGANELLLAVSILEFHIDPENQARLLAQWQVTKNGEILLSRDSAYRVAASGDEVSLKIEALNRCLSQFDREIASALISLY